MIRNLAISVVALGALLWVSVAEAQPVHTAAGCQSRIGNFNKRARCMACVRQGGVFKKQGRKRPGFCKQRPAPRRPVAPPPAATPARPAHRGPGVMRSKRDCRTHIALRHKRKRCRRCVREGGLFHKFAGRGHGFCRFPSSRTWVVANTIRTVQGCNARVRRHNKRSRCLSCVNYGGIFQKRGFGYCRGAMAPAPPPRPRGTVHSVTGCNRRIARPGKRSRCVSCVSRAGVFHKQGPGTGYCRGAKPLASTLYSAHDCGRFIVRAGKRARCVSCTSGRGQFVTQGAGRGFCRGAAPPPAPPVKIYSVADCSRFIARPGKRGRCVSCTSARGHFVTQGRGTGFCRRAATPPPPPVKIYSASDCGRFIARAGKRARCIRCTSKRGHFVTQGRGTGFCRGAAAPPPPRRDTVHSVPGCQSRVGRIPKRKRCVHCVRSGGVFHKQGAGTGFCRGGRARVPGRPLGAAIRTPGGCKTRIARPHKKGRCLACVRGRRTFYRQGSGRGTCR